MYSRVNVRRAVLTAAAVLATSLAPVVSPVAASAAGGPSVALPDTPSVPVSSQAVSPRAEDAATLNSLRGNQGSKTTDDGGGVPTATSLAPSASWQMSPHTGDFTWSYPLRVPPAAGGLVPNLALSYRSSAVDGHTSATNNQPSWVGDGWSLAPGFVERTYGACADDTEGGVTPPKTGDLCWRSDNATAAYGGGGGMLVRNDANGDWRTQNDDGSRVERLIGIGNGDNDGESWKITTVDGTQYWFGSQADSKSTWTVPVFGDDAGEPCYRPGSFDTSNCVQAWRWNLDKVVDRNGNMIRYYYAPETNSYGLNLKDAAVPYVRGGTLERIDYGVRDTITTPSGRVVFTTANRCVRESVCDEAHRDNWPDVVWENKCDSSTCKDRYSPTFWSTKRLATITTQVWKDGGLKDVDRWSLDHQFPDPGDGEKAALWLRGITHTGLVGSSLSEPAVTFEGTAYANRVHKIDGIAPLNRYRITGVISETGGLVTVSYSPECKEGGPMPANPESNTLRCFPVRWATKNARERTDYFHKYVVAGITQSDRLSTSTQQVTSYEYLDGAAWHWDTSEFIREDKKTWNEFRGFGRVRTRSGAANDLAGPVTMFEQRFYRGMNGDKLPSGTRSVSVSDTEGGVRTDHNWLQGFGFETGTFEREAPSAQPDPPRTTKSISEPAWQGPTATRGGFHAYLVNAGTERGFTALSSGGWRVTKTETTFDDRGLATQINDLGEVATTEDDRCVRTTYARNTGAWLLNLPAHVEAVSVHCGQSPQFPKDAIADSRTTYDGNGNVKKAEVAKDRPAAGAVYVAATTATYDMHGRVTSATNALGHTAKTRFTPEVGGPVTQITSTMPGTAAVPEGLVTTTTLEPAWGKTKLITDPNGHRTEIAYDALGRSTATWLPNRPRSENPKASLRFAYVVRNDAPTAVTTTRISPNGTDVSSTVLYDGLLRPRQVQAPAVGGGRLLTDTRYDSQGRVWMSTQPYFNNAGMDTTLWVAADNDMPGHTRSHYDGAGRPDVASYFAGATEKWRSTTTYGGDRVDVTPPAGGTATTTITDARGQTRELRQYTTPGVSGSFDTTRYSYSKAGKLATVTDPAGSSWSRGYDLLGRAVTSEDPDTGTVTKTYDDAGQLITSRNADGTTVAYAYDTLGRKTGTFLGEVGGTQLAGWTYDTVDLGMGQPASSTRWVTRDGTTHAYTSTVLNYNELYKPTGTSLTIPSSEGLLAGTYTSYAGYDPDGTPSNEDYSAAGELPAETVNYDYNDFGLPTTTRGGYDGVTNTLVGDTQFTRYGELARVQLGTGTKRAWLSSYYDTNTRRLNRSIVDAEVSNPMQADVHYTYNDAGIITSIADTPVSATPDVQCFRSDYLQRITDAWTPGVGTWSETTGCRNAPSTAGLAGPAPYWHSYTFDKSGNRRTETQHAAAGDTTRTHTYQTPGHAHALTTTATQTPVGAAAVEQYDYNPSGTTKTRTRAGVTQQFTWDVEGHLAAVTENGKTTSFVYDASGSRLIRKDPDATTLYLGNQEVRVNHSGGNPTATRYYSHGGAVVAMRQGRGALTWLAGDHQGTAQLAINSTSLEVTLRRQLPFGNPRGTAVSWPGDRGFVGGTTDASTGLTHLGAREYDPSTGRFISVDPLMDLTDPQQMNGYTYSNNNPITGSDPSGLMPGHMCPDGGCSKPGGGGSAPPASSTPPQSGGCGARPCNVGHFNPHTVNNGCGARACSIGSVNPDNVNFEPAKVNIVKSFPDCQVSEGALLAGVALCDGPPPDSEVGHALLDVCGQVPGWGEPCDVFNAFIYLTEGDPANAGISGLGVIPLLGNAATAARRSAKGSCSFTGDTQVLMADGTTKPISEIKIGDQVLAADPETGEEGPRAVTAVLVHEDTVFDLVTEDGAKVTTTEDHPFWNATDKQWQRADRLDPGDQLVTATGHTIRVSGLRTNTRHNATAYNLTVDGLHTYHVRTQGAGTGADLLVHNTCEIDFVHDARRTLVAAESAPTVAARVEVGDGMMLITAVPRAERVARNKLPAGTESDLLRMALQLREVGRGDRLVVTNILDPSTNADRLLGREPISTPTGRTVSDALEKLGINGSSMIWLPDPKTGSLHIEVIVGG